MQVSPSLFKAYDIRGVVPATLTPEVARAIGLAFGTRAMLHAPLLHDVHPVRIAPGRIEIRPRPAAPRDLAAQLTALLA